MSPNATVFGWMLLVSCIVFCTACYRRLSLVGIGQADQRTAGLGRGLWQVLSHAIAQKRVVSKSFGLNHAVIFWSFLVLLLANAEFVASSLVPSFSLAVLPFGLHHGLLFLFDAASLLALVAVFFAFARRLFFPPASMSSAYVKARSFEGFFILTLIASLMLAYFGMHAATIARGDEAAASAMPVSSFIASLLGGLNPEQLSDLGGVSWWVHAVALLLFLCFLPLSKHMHILTAIPNLFLADPDGRNTLPREEFVKGGSYGVAKVDEFTWKDLLDGFACTECGRCQASCPAASTGKPLNPRQVIHAIKVNLLANGPSLRHGGAPKIPLIGAEGEGTTSEDAVWSCTTCGICMSVCPVLIEHMPKVVKMRRQLVQMKSSFPEELLTLFENMEGRSNPWGIAPTERTKWHSGMEVKPFEAGKTEYLFWAGCAGAFDSRQKHATVAMATILNAAGVSWGTLGKDEKCCGDSLRRLGNEYVFDKLARENVHLFKERGVVKVVTQCPHCFTTLKNDYRQYGIELEVVHHSELIAELIKSGRLKLNKKVTELGKLLFHDSCYLGRHNDVYEAPRQAIQQATGARPDEFDRNGKESFCCGAGGGRMWQEETEGERINLNRVKEAVAKKPDTICVSCPYCMTMMEDGLKDLQATGTQVKELAEVVAEALRQ
ncbi:electron transfer flavoprotein [Geomonas sp. Red276]